MAGWGIPLVVGLALVASHAAGAQDSTYFPLTVPHGVPLRCHAVDSAGTTTVAMSLGEAPQTPVREIEARYDSLGRALSITDWGNTVTSATDARMDVVVVWLVGG